MKVAVISGGSGGATILRGLKDRVSDLTAIVTMFDSGGSTGRLRDEFGILPPGDVRSCILALAPEKKQHVLRELLNYRFSSKGELNGHNVGNLILAALTDITGREDEAIEALSSLLQIHGRVLPVSLDHSHLYARLASGQIVEGETNIDLRTDADYAIKKVFLDPNAKIYQPAQKAIEEADVVIFGPGDLYTSVIPPLLVKGVSKALSRTKAKLVYVVNIMTKQAETKGYDASMHVREVLRYAHREHLDAVICAKNSIRKDLLAEYAKEGKEPVHCDESALLQYADTVVIENLVSQSDILRHDSEKLATAVLDLFEKKAGKRKSK